MVSFSEGRCLPVVEVQCVIVGCEMVGGDVLKFGGVFVAVVVVVEAVLGGSKLKVVAVVTMVCSCVNGELYSFWRLSRKSLEEKISNVDDLSCGDADRFFDGVLFVGGGWFNRECGSGRNGCGSVLWVKRHRSMSLISSLVLIWEVVVICECVSENSVGRGAIER